MPKQKCQCGAKYTFPESAVGKRAKCAKCGAVMTLRDAEDQGPIRIAGDSNGITDGSAVAVASPATLGPAFVPPVPIIEEAVVERPPPGYAGALFGAFTFLRSPQNIIVFVIVWFLLFVQAALLPAAGCIGVIGGFVVAGWVSAFKFNIIAEAAAGETDLPEVTLSEGIMDGIIVPLLRWIGSWLIVLLPMIITASVLAGLGRLGPNFTVFALYDAGFLELLRDGSPELLALGALAYAGVFMWPMVVLCVALGGFASFSRPDLIISTMVRTLPAYLLTVIIVVGVDMVAQLIGQSLAHSDWTQGYFLKGALAAALDAYLAIAAMSTIGLYYRYFKDRFAWSWE